MNSKELAKIVCPYLKSETGMSITCESEHDQDFAEISYVFKFESKESKDEWLQNNCYIMKELDCPVAKTLYRKYGDEE